MEELTAYELRLTHGALKGDQAGPDLPVDVLPLDLLLVVHVLNEAVQVKEAVCYMLSYNLTMEVNENLSVCAHHPLVLLSRVQLAAIDTATEQGATLVLTVSTLIIADRPTRGAK